MRGTFRLGTIGRAAILAGLVMAAASPGLGPAHAQTLAAAPGSAATERARREDSLRLLEQSLRNNAEARGRLENEIAVLKGDGAKLAAALVAAAYRARAAEERLRATEARLDELGAGERAIRHSLGERRAVLGQILAALQRMGLHPPPALLVRPRDVLDAVRSASLLGTLAPGLREEARRLATELAELGRIRAAIDADRVALEADHASLAGERDRLTALVAARQERIAGIEADMRKERSRGEALGRDVRTLRDLLDRTEAESDRARPPVAAGPTAPPASPGSPGRDEDGRELRERFAAAETREPARLAPRLPLADMRGALTRPAVGPSLKEFGAPDGSGGLMRGAAIGTRPRAVVTAPADGTIVFAGPFRSYGRVLIINASGGYYFMLAGLDRLGVEIGQFVIAGEPLGTMGETAAPSAALGVVEADGPILYVELRKDGIPIDPGPWWAKSQSERARG